MVAVLSVCDAAGVRLFDHDKDTVAKMSKKSGRALERIFQAAVKLNRLDDKSVKALEGNSESGQSDDSGSA
jgi:hypothetical protein